MSDKLCNTLKRMSFCLTWSQIFAIISIYISIIYLTLSFQLIDLIIDCSICWCMTFKYDGPDLYLEFLVVSFVEIYSYLRTVQMEKDFDQEDLLFSISIQGRYR